MSFKLQIGENKCTNSEYHSDTSFISSSGLKLLLKNPEKFYKEVIQGKRINESKAAYDEGSYAHSLILEPHMIGKEYAFFPGFKKQGKEWEEFKVKNSKKVILSKPQKHRVEQWVDTFRKLPSAVSLIKNGESEKTIASVLKDVPVKARADYANITEGYIVDVKTTSFSPDIDSFKLVIDQLSYDLSASLYTMIFEEFYKKKFDFYFVVLGKKHNQCEVFKVSQETLIRGKSRVLEALVKYKKCKETNIWSNTTKDVKDVGSDLYEILEV